MDLKQHLVRQMAFSHATFGPGERTGGVIDHIRKELAEVEEANGESSEWVDVVILAMDGLTRRLAYCNGERRDPAEVARIACSMIEGKQSRNEARTWPDWRTQSQDEAIEHDRSGEINRVEGVVDTEHNLGSTLYRLRGDGEELLSASAAKIEVRADKLFTHVHIAMGLPGLERYFQVRRWVAAPSTQPEFHCYRRPERTQRIEVTDQP